MGRTYTYYNVRRQVLDEDRLLRKTVEANTDTRNITFAYLPGQAPADEYSDYAPGLCDAEWPEIQADVRMPHPYYIAKACRKGGFDVDLRLMDPQCHFKAGTTSFVRVINQVSYNIDDRSLNVYDAQNFVFDHAQEDVLTQGDLELPVVLRGVARSLRILQCTYAVGMHGYWDIE